LSNKLAALQFYRLPGYTYIMDRTTNLIGAPWVGITTNRAATNGVLAAEDNSNGSVPGPAYYRWRWQP
jgi:hypothetical protein